MEWGAVPKVMTATLNVVVSINSITVMQTYWTAPSEAKRRNEYGFADGTTEHLLQKILAPKKNNILNFNIFYNFSIMAL